MPKGVFSLVSCIKCDKPIKSNAISRHEKSCGKSIEKKKRVAWNKGLNKTDSRIAKMAVKVGEALRGKPGTPITEAAKLKLSALQSSRLYTAYANGTRPQAGGYCEWFEFDGIMVQGTWELRTAKILSRWKHNGKILSWSRCPYRIPYIVDGKSHTYNPDFLVKNLDGAEYILEVKGRKSLVDDIKWSAARKSFDLVVWGLHHIQNNELE